MSAIITVVGQVVTAAVSWVGSWAGIFTSATEGVLNNPILIIPIALAFAGFGVGILKRLMSVK